MALLRALCCCTVAPTAVGGTIVATLYLGPAVKHTPSLFFCAVVFSAWFCGLWAGIFASLLSVIALDYYFIPPLGALGISLEEAPDMIVFVVSALFISWLSAERKRTKNPPAQTHDDLEATFRDGASEDGKTKDQLAAEIARVMRALIQDQAEAPRAGQIEAVSKPAPIPGEPKQDIRKIEDLRGPQSTFCPREESMFFRQGDYWTVQYQGQVARLKATRGLYCLAYLLEHPGREFHVSELATVGLVQVNSKKGENEFLISRFQDAGPILDARAKVEYSRRLEELRGELQEGERLNDPERVEKARQERDCIADQLAMAVGLGGRDRKTASEAERARSAITKRIKDSIHKLTEAMPSLGRHLAATIKTGYFCSYAAGPDRRVEWKVRY
jgi:Domain of unknown function (DUF4118)